MPTKIVKFDCNICGRRYDLKKDAQICEDQGPGTEYPIGCIYANHEDGAFYQDITFAVASNSVERHSNNGGSWACRSNNYGDSLGTEHCGGSSLSLNEYDSHINVGHPTFKRMVKWLQSQNIDITVWDGEKAVPLNKWLGKVPDKNKVT